MVYVEAGDLNRLTEKARESGQTLVEWARETLLGELENSAKLPRPDGVRLVRRRSVDSCPTETIELDAVAAEGPRGKATVERRSEKQCKHGVGKGWHCWQCGGIAVIDA